MKAALQKILQPTPRAVGLEIGESAVRVAEVRGDRVVRYDQEPLPPEAVDRGELADPEAVASALHALVRRNNLRRRFAVLSVPDARLHIQVLPLPRPEEADAVAREAVPMREGATIAYRVLPPADPGSPHDIMVIAAVRETIDNYAEVVQAAGLNLLGAEPHFAGALHFVEPAIAGTEDAPAVFLSLGRSSSVLLIAYNGAVRYAATLDLTLRDLIERIQRNNAYSSFDEAEQAYVSYLASAAEPGATATRVNLSSDIERFAGDLLARIGNHYETFSSQQLVPLKPPRQVFLAGGGALAPWLQQALAHLWENEQLQVLPINPFAHLRPPPRIGAPADPPRWASVLGHALVGSHAEVEYAFDLLPPELRRRYTPDWYRLGAAALVLGAVAAGSLYYRGLDARLQAQTLEIQTLESKAAALKPFLLRQAELKREKARVEATTARLEALKERQTPWVPTLGWFFATLPREGEDYQVRVEKLTATTREQRGNVIQLRLSISGQAKDRATLVRWMRRVENHPDFRFGFNRARRIYQGHLAFEAELFRTKRLPAPAEEQGGGKNKPAGGGVNR